MKIAVSTDERTNLVEVLIDELSKRGMEVIYIGPQKGESMDWPDVTFRAVNCVKNREADEAIIFCWTGTGASIAANKVKGIRAALCKDAEAAKGARIWNHANVLALSLGSTSETELKEILDAWFSTPYSDDEWNKKQIQRIREIESEE